MDVILSNADCGKTLSLNQEAAAQLGIALPTQKSILVTYLYRLLLPIYMFLNIPCPRPEELTEENIQSLGELHALFFNEYAKQMKGANKIIITDGVFHALYKGLLAAAALGNDSYFDFLESLSIDVPKNARNVNASSTAYSQIQKANGNTKPVIQNIMQGGMLSVKKATRSSNIVPATSSSSQTSMQLVPKQMFALSASSGSSGLPTRSSAALVKIEATQNAMIARGEKNTELFKYLEQCRTVNRAMQLLLSELTGTNKNSKIAKEVRNLFSSFIQQIASEAEEISMAGRSIRVKAIKGNVENYIARVEERYGSLNIWDFSTLMPGKLYGKRDVLLSGLASLTAFLAYSAFTSKAGGSKLVFNPMSVKYTFPVPTFPERTTLVMNNNVTAIYLVDNNVVLTPEAQALANNTTSLPVLTDDMLGKPIPINSAPIDNDVVPYSWYDPSTWDWTVFSFSEPVTSNPALPVLPVNNTAIPTVFKYRGNVVVQGASLISRNENATIYNPPSHFSRYSGSVYDKIWDPIKQQWVPIMFPDTNGLSYDPFIDEYVDVKAANQLDMCLTGSTYMDPKFVATGIGLIPTVTAYTGSPYLGLAAGIVPVGYNLASGIGSCYKPITLAVASKTGDVAANTFTFLKGGLMGIVALLAAYLLFASCYNRFRTRSLAKDKQTRYDKVIRGGINKYAEQVLYQELRKSLTMSVNFYIEQLPDAELTQYFVNNNLINPEMIEDFKAKMRSIESSKKSDDEKNKEREKTSAAFQVAGIMQPFVTAWYQSVLLHFKNELNLEDTDPIIVLAKATAYKVASDNQILKECLRLFDATTATVIEENLKGINFNEKTRSVLQAVRGMNMFQATQSNVGSAQVSMPPMGGSLPGNTLIATNMAGLQRVVDPDDLVFQTPEGTSVRTTAGIAHSQITGITDITTSRRTTGTAPRPRGNLPSSSSSAVVAPTNNATSSSSLLAPARRGNNAATSSSSAVVEPVRRGNNAATSSSSAVVEPVRRVNNAVVAPTNAATSSSSSSAATSSSSSATEESTQNGGPTTPIFGQGNNATEGGRRMRSRRSTRKQKKAIRKRKPTRKH